MSTGRHAQLTSLGISPSVRADREQLMVSRGGEKFRFVLFCAAPSASGEAYPTEVPKGGSWAEVTEKVAIIQAGRWAR
jgi:hypothetical protein